MQTPEPYLPKQGVTIDDEATVVSPVYAVRFRAGRQAANPMPNSYSSHGKGSVQFRGDELLIDAQRHRPFRHARAEQAVALGVDEQFIAAELHAALAVQGVAVRRRVGGLPPGAEAHRVDGADHRRVILDRHSRLG